MTVTMTARLAAIIEDVEHLLTHGVARAEIPTRVGYKNQRDLERVLARAGRGDLARRLRGAEVAA